MFKVLLVSLIFCFISSQAQASLFMELFTNIRLSNPAQSCRMLFKNPNAREVRSYILEQSSRGTAEHFSELPRGGQDLSIRRHVEQVINDWIKFHNYDPIIDKARLLRTDASLTLERTSYFGFRYLKRIGMIRLFDGSSRPNEYDGVPFPYKVDGKKLPFEKRLKEEENFEFPERILERETGKPAYLLNIGLIDIHNVFKDGALSLLHMVARDIDARYNSRQMKEAQSVEELQSKGVMIYVNASKLNARLNERFGFQYIEVVKNGKTQRLQMQDGLFIMKIEAAEFVKKFTDKARAPKLTEREDPWFEKQRELVQTIRSTTHAKLIEMFGFHPLKSSEQLLRERAELEQRLSQSSKEEESKIHYEILLKELELNLFLGGNPQGSPNPNSVIMDFTFQ